MTLPRTATATAAAARSVACLAWAAARLAASMSFVDGPATAAACRVIIRLSPR